MQARCRLVVVGMTAFLTACGSAAATATPDCLATRQPTAHAQAVNGHVRAVSDVASVAPGGTATFTVTVTAPADYEADCTAPLTLTITDVSGLAIENDGAPPEASGTCGSVALRGSETAVYATTWQPDSTLPDGNYTVQLAAGDLPPVTLVIPVKTAAGVC